MNGMNGKMQDSCGCGSCGGCGNGCGNALGELDSLIARYESLGILRDDINKAFDIMSDSVRDGGVIYTAGNGGSAADSEHIVGELMKSFKIKRPIPQEQKATLKELFGEEGETLGTILEGAVPAMALTSTLSLNTALANDTDPAVVYAQQVYGLGRKGDVLVVISTSGNAKNCMYAAYAAKLRGMRIIALTGAKGGKLQATEGLCDVVLRAPETETYKVQELHLPIYHCLCAMLEMEFFA